MLRLKSACQELGTLYGHGLHAFGVDAAEVITVSANGVIFSTLEDETGIANIITWPKTLERYRRTVLAARLLGVRGTLQREQGVIHVVARELVDLSADLNSLSEKHGGTDAFLSPADHVKHGGEEPRGKPRRRKGSLSEVLPKGRNFQ
jgi:error-prone DNA polymerase